MAGQRSATRRFGWLVPIAALLGVGAVRVCRDQDQERASAERRLLRAPPRVPQVSADEAQANLLADFGNNGAAELAALERDVAALGFDLAACERQLAALRRFEVETLTAQPSYAPFRQRLQTATAAIAKKRRLLGPLADRAACQVVGPVVDGTDAHPDLWGTKCKHYNAREHRKCGDMCACELPVVSETGVTITCAFEAQVAGVAAREVRFRFENDRLLDLLVLQRPGQYQAACRYRVDVRNGASYVTGGTCDKGLQCSDHICR